MEESQVPPIILAVLPSAEDRAALEQIFLTPDWTLRSAVNLAAARQELQTLSIAVIIAESCFPGGRWIDLLRVIETMSNPPPLIVTDRFADERLWAEVLNLGGHDLLAKPFDAEEVRYAVTMACRRRQNQQRMIARREFATYGEHVAAGAAKARTAEVLSP